MTTKKQKREQAEARRAEYDAETKRMGLEAMKRDHEKREQKQFELQRATRARTTKAAVKKIKNAPLPDNLAVSYANAQGIDLPKEDEAHIVFVQSLFEQAVETTMVNTLDEVSAENAQGIDLPKEEVLSEKHITYLEYLVASAENS